MANLSMSSPIYVPFLLYFTAAAYTLIFIVWKAVQNYEVVHESNPFTISTDVKGLFLMPTDHRFKELWKYYLPLGLITGISSACAQYSDLMTSLELQSILSNLVLPATYLAAVIFLRKTEKPSWKQSIGAFVVFAGTIVASVPNLIGPWGNSNPIGAIVFAAGVLGSSFVDIIQRVMFEPQYGVYATLLPQLIWANLISIPIFLLTVFLTKIPIFGGMNPWPATVASFECVYGVQPLPDGCQTGAWVWIFAFVFFYTGYFYFQSKLVRDYDPIFQCIVITLVSPLSAYAEWIPYFGGKAVGWPVHLGVVLIAVGSVLYRYFGKKKENEHPLLAPIA